MRETDRWEVWYGYKTAVEKLKEGEEALSKLAPLLQSPVLKNDRSEAEVLRRRATQLVHDVSLVLEDWK